MSPKFLMGKICFTFGFWTKLNGFLLKNKEGRLKNSRINGREFDVVWRQSNNPSTIFLININNHRSLI